MLTPWLSHASGPALESWASWNRDLRHVHSLELSRAEVRHEERVAVRLQAHFSGELTCRNLSDHSGLVCKGGGYIYRTKARRQAVAEAVRVRHDDHFSA